MHYRQLMTLDIGNDALLCKVFPASLQGQALSWFHRLPPNFVGNFRDLSEAFVGQYLCSARHKQNISTLSSSEASVQALHFSNHLPKSLLQQWMTYSGAPTNIQCSKMTYVQPPNKFWLSDDHLEVMRREILNLRIGQSRLTEGRKGQVARKDGQDPKEQTHPQGIIARGVPSTRNTKLLRAASVRERINSIRPGLNGGGPRPIDETIIFPPVDPTQTLQPHRDALILSLEIGDFDVRRILVDPGSSADLVQASVVGHMGHNLAGLENPGRIMSGFNGSSTTSLGDIILPVQAGPVTLNVQFSVVQELSPFNIILGRTWLHYMKAIPSTYHQMVSFLTNEGQIDLYGSQFAAHQCYQIAREAGANQEDTSPPEPSHAHNQ
ncbi:hypothetical protein CK203_098467 [Vitis vinifera]|uniref:Retrotransposon gag domain-containing protein n=1 Tax=Vitis vinifera TaxID=29760 RepID=A0A438FIQ4_VITVI|nr:hypothetical protein CK203_098467 [Vitis vinifera]